MNICVLGVDVGGTRLRMGLLSADGEMLDFHMRDSAFLSGVDAPTRLADCLKEYMRSAPAPVRAAAVGFPSTLDASRRRLLSTPNLNGLSGVDIADLLENALRVPVFPERDVNLLVRHDIKALDLWDADPLLGVYVGTGLGNVVCVGGKPLIGAHGAAAELGHIPFAGRDDPCPCGGRGCAELYVGGKALKCRAGDDIDRVFTLHGDDEFIKRYVDDLARVIATEITLIDPAVILLGGGVLAMEGFPVEAFKALVSSYVRKPLPSGGLRFALSPGGQRAGVIGAGLYAIERLEALV